MGRLLRGPRARRERVSFRSAGRALNPQPRYASWEKLPYEQFEKKVPIGVLVAAKDNFFAFRPMVASIVSSEVESRDVAGPLRRALITPGASFRRADLKGIDHERQVVQIGSGVRFPCDRFVLALGGRANFFGIPGVEEHGLAMRGIEAASKDSERT